MALKLADQVCGVEPCLQSNLAGGWADALSGVPLLLCWPQLKNVLPEKPWLSQPCDMSSKEVLRLFSPACIPVPRLGLENGTSPC